MCLRQVDRSIHGTGGFFTVDDENENSIQSCDCLPISASSGFHSSASSTALPVMLVGHVFSSVKGRGARRPPWFVAVLVFVGLLAWLNPPPVSAAPTVVSGTTVSSDVTVAAFDSLPLMISNAVVQGDVIIQASALTSAGGGSDTLMSLPQPFIVIRNSQVLGGIRIEGPVDCRTSAPDIVFTTAGCSIVIDSTSATRVSVLGLRGVVTFVISNAPLIPVVIIGEILGISGGGLWKDGAMPFPVVASPPRFPDVLLSGFAAFTQLRLPAIRDGANVTIASSTVTGQAILGDITGASWISFVSSTISSLYFGGFVSSAVVVIRRCLIHSAIRFESQGALPILRLSLTLQDVTTLDGNGPVSCKAANSTALLLFSQAVVGGDIFVLRSGRFSTVTQCPFSFLPPVLPSYSLVRLRKGMYSSRVWMRETAVTSIAALAHAVRLLQVDGPMFRSVADISRSGIATLVDMPSDSSGFVAPVANFVGAVRQSYIFLTHMSIVFVESPLGPFKAQINICYLRGSFGEAPLISDLVRSAKTGAASALDPQLPAQLQLTEEETNYFLARALLLNVTNAYTSSPYFTTANSLAIPATVKNLIPPIPDGYATLVAPPAVFLDGSLRRRLQRFPVQSSGAVILLHNLSIPTPKDTKSGPYLVSVLRTDNIPASPTDITVSGDPPASLYAIVTQVAVSGKQRALPYVATKQDFPQAAADDPSPITVQGFASCNVASLTTSTATIDDVWTQFTAGAIRYLDSCANPAGAPLVTRTLTQPQRKPRTATVPVVLTPTSTDTVTSTTGTSATTTTTAASTITTTGTSTAVSSITGGPSTTAAPPSTFRPRRRTTTTELVSLSETHLSSTMSTSIRPRIRRRSKSRSRPSLSAVSVTSTLSSSLTLGTFYVPIFDAAGGVTRSVLSIGSSGLVNPNPVPLYVQVAVTGSSERASSTTVPANTTTTHLLALPDVTTTQSPPMATTLTSLFLRVRFESLPVKDLSVATQQEMDNSDAPTEKNLIQLPNCSAFLVVRAETANPNGNGAASTPATTARPQGLNDLLTTTAAPTSAPAVPVVRIELPVYVLRSAARRWLQANPFTPQVPAPTAPVAPPVSSTTGLLSPPPNASSSVAQSPSTTVMSQVPSPTSGGTGSFVTADTREAAVFVTIPDSTFYFDFREYSRFSVKTVDTAKGAEEADKFGAIAVTLASLIDMTLAPTGACFSSIQEPGLVSRLPTAARPAAIASLQRRLQTAPVTFNVSGTPVVHDPLTISGSLATLLSFGSAIGGCGTAVLDVHRAETVYRLAFCRRLDISFPEPPWYENVLQLWSPETNKRVLNEKNGLELDSGIYVRPMIGNLIVGAVFTLCVFIEAAIRIKRQNRFLTLFSLVEAARAPSVPLICFLWLMQPTLSFGVMCMTSKQDASVRGAGLTVMIIVSLFAIFAVFQATRTPYRAKLLRKGNEGSTEANSGKLPKTLRLWRHIMDPEFVWCEQGSVTVLESIDEFNFVSATQGSFVKRHFSIIGQYLVPQYFVVDCVASVCFALVDAANIRGWAGCRALIGSLLGVAVLSFAALAWRRPFTTRIDTYAALATMLFLMLALIIALVTTTKYTPIWLLCVLANVVVCIRGACHWAWLVVSLTLGGVDGMRKQKVEAVNDDDVDGEPAPDLPLLQGEKDDEKDKTVNVADTAVVPPGGSDADGAAALPPPKVSSSRKALPAAEYARRASDALGSLQGSLAKLDAAHRALEKARRAADHPTALKPAAQPPAAGTSPPRKSRRNAAARGRDDDSDVEMQRATIAPPPPRPSQSAGVPKQAASMVDNSVVPVSQAALQPRFVRDGPVPVGPAARHGTQPKHLRALEAMVQLICQLRREALLESHQSGIPPNVQRHGIAKAPPGSRKPPRAVPDGNL